MRISDWSSDVCSSDLISEARDERAQCASANWDVRGDHGAFDEGAACRRDLGRPQTHPCRKPGDMLSFLAAFRFDDHPEPEMAAGLEGPCPRTACTAGRSAERRVGKECVRTC